MPDDLPQVQEGKPPAAPNPPNPFVQEAARMKASQAPGGGPARGTQAPGPLWGHTPPIIDLDEHHGRPRRTWPWVLVVILIVAVVGASYVMLGKQKSGQQLANVPGIVGLSEAEATAKIQAAGFRYLKQGQELSADTAQGMVLRQDPQESGKLERGKTIGYWVSSGTGQIAVPNVVGMSHDQAAARLIALGLTVSTRDEVSAAKPAGTVLRQNPEATKLVDAGTAVAITVAAATNTVKVPLLSGMSKDSALAALGSLNLKGTVQAVASKLPGGTVVGQAPAAGIEVEPGTSVTVNVSNAPAPTTVRVPAVATIGMTQSQAKAKLAQYGLRARVINEENPNFKPGLCIYQNPAAGVTVKIGSTVSITIARKPTTTTTVTPPST
jgi:eukaryotic-like serine/threonine-protein kinase